MNTTKLLKNFDPKNLEKTVASLVNIKATEIDVTYVAFDKNHHCVGREKYLINPCPYRKYSVDWKKCPSVNKAVNKILTMHSDAYLDKVSFNIFTGNVEISIYEDV